MFSIDILGFWGGFPVNGGAASSYLVSTDQGSLLMDCGSGSLTKLSKFSDLYSIDGLILSHLHNDHVADVLTLEHALIVAERLNQRHEPLPVYSPTQPTDAFARLKSPHFDHQAIGNGMKIERCGMQIEFLAVQHTVPCYAVKMIYQDRTLVYTADTEYFPELVNFCKGADLLLCEASIVEGSNHTSGKGHMSGLQAGSLAYDAQVGKLILTHLPSDGHHKQIKADAEKAFIGPVHLASERSSWAV